MSDERVLIAGSERERLLVQAGIEEGPSEAGIRAAERVLGLAPGASVGADHVAKPTAGSPIAGRLAAPGMIPLVAGALALGAIGATLYAGSRRRAVDPLAVAEALLPAASSAAPAPEAAGRDPGANRRLLGAVSPAPESAPTSSRENAGPVAVAAGRRGENGAHVQSSPAAPPRAREGLESEIASVDLARRQAASGDWAGALRSLDDHDRRYPNGVLSEEADLLRLEAVAAERENAVAALLAQRFLVRHPASVHAETVRSLLGGATR